MSSGPAAVVVPQQPTERFATADRVVASLMRRFQRMAPMGTCLSLDANEFVGGRRAQRLKP
jgi:hypothetical protein